MEKKNRNDLGKNKTIRARGPVSPWWNAECEKVVENRKRALAKFKESHTREDFLAFKRTEGIAKYKLQREKKNNFVKFCKGLNRLTSPTYIWKKIKCFKNRWTQTSTRRLDSRERERKVMDEIERLCVPWVPKDRPTLKNNNTGEFLDREYSSEELDRAIKSTRIGSAPGLDGIDYNLIRHF